VSAIVSLALVHVSRAEADELRGSVQGFGGMSFGSFSALPDASFGGMVIVGLTPNIQVLGEAGRLGNVLPPMTTTLLGFSPIGVGVSAWYAEGGVRFTTGPGSGVRPYVETAGGVARLSPHVAGIGNPLALAGLRFLESTDPLASVGGGVTLEAGRFMADIGYRHRRVFSSSWMSALTLGDSLRSNEIRIGLGVRF
jgi:opacity protein-like surface antigen